MCIWLFLYLWSDAYHESDGKRLWPRLITVGCAYILILAALTIAQRLSYHLPGSKYEGSFPYMVLSMTSAHMIIGACGLTIYSGSFLRIFGRKQDSPAATFRYKRIREMFICSSLMVLFGCFGFGMMTFVAAKRFFLSLSGKLTVYLNTAVAFSEVTWAVLLMIMLTSLFFGQLLSAKLVRPHLRLNEPLMERTSDTPQMYDV